MWGIFEGDDIHVVPCDDEGHVYGGHELSRDCKCHPKAVNKMLTNSLLFNPVWDPERYHAMLAFGWRDGRWVVSLYSTREDVDRGAICKARGGGGHQGAAGFQCDTETIQGLLSARVG